LVAQGSIYFLGPALFKKVVMLLSKGSFHKLPFVNRINKLIALKKGCMQGQLLVYFGYDLLFFLVLLTIGHIGKPTPY